MKKEIVGKKFGKLTVVSEAEKRRSNGERNYNCVCECGNERVVSGSNLRSGHTTSCGCVRKNATVVLSAVKKAFKAAAKKKIEKTPPKAVSAAGIFGNRVAEMVPIGMVEVNRNIRRGEITPESDPKILELVDSIKQIGILEPLIVNDTHSDNSKYQLIAGHRRLAAATIAECEQVPAIIYDNLDNRRILEIQISENLHRVDLRPTEIADVYIRMRDELGLAVDEIAQRIGRSPAHVYQYIQLLTLPEAILKEIDAGDIGIAKALVLCTLPSGIIKKLLQSSYNDILYKTTAREFPNKIKQIFLKDLTDGHKYFNINKKYTDKDGKTWPACTDCPHKKQTSLFVDVFENSVCPDSNCYWAKDNIAYENKQAEQRQVNRWGGRDGNSDDYDENEIKAGKGVWTEEKKREYEETCRMVDEKRKNRESEENNERRLKAIKHKEKTEYYLDRKLVGEFNAADCYFYVHDADDMESYYQVDNEMLGELYQKYTGKTFAEIKEKGTADDVLKAMLIYHIYDTTEYGSRDVAEWVGCEIHPDDKPDDENDAEDDK